MALYACCSWAAAPSPLPVQAFFSYSRISNVTISPDGKYLAAAISGDPDSHGSNMLLILNADDLKPTAKFNLDARQEPQYIYRYWWVSDSRLLIATARKTGSFDSPVLDGALFGINADGSNERVLMGKSNFFRQLVAVPPVNGGQVIVEAFAGEAGHDVFDVLDNGWIRRDWQRHLYRLNYNNGDIQEISTPVAYGEALADQNGLPRAVWGDDPTTGIAHLFVASASGDRDWSEVKDFASPDHRWNYRYSPMGFMSDNQTLYVLIGTSSGTTGLAAVDPVTGKQSMVFGDPAYDIDVNLFFDGYGHDGDGLIWSFDYGEGRHVVAVETMPGLPEVHVVDAKDPKAQQLAALYELFHGERVEITSNTRDHSRAVVHVTSDRNPGAFYLYDTTTRKADLLLTSKHEIDPKTMADMQPVMFKSRDGLVLHGYLTTPPDEKPEKLPMILLVHGGPHGVRDEWGWNPEAQYFASRGYAVLQVNYRGSGGYGDKFEEAGYGHWGTTMQDDLADAVQWAEQQGVADPKRVCIYGASYGGYAALESAIRYPALYRCTVGYVGLYDLTLWGKGDLVQDIGAQEQGDIYLGADANERKRHSPVFDADKLTVPALIVYGGKDERVVPENAEEMMKAMDKAGKAYEKLYEPMEGHGFIKPEHNYELYTRMLAFFEKYIGSGATQPTAAPVVQTNKAP